eukprot:Lithocolla_globosa_v1_NODE_45_length_8054_cov_9.461981.p7 type:complete len:106 gc:universal NODE_45_length_8054_cov_9.461981:1541-1858(+)
MLFGLQHRDTFFRIRMEKFPQQVSSRRQVDHSQMFVLCSRGPITHLELLHFAHNVILPIDMQERQVGTKMVQHGPISPYIHGCVNDHWLFVCFHIFMMSFKLIDP